MRSFFQDFGEDDFGNVRFKMHDIVHDLVHILTKKVAFDIEVKDANKRIELPGYKVRHLTLIALEDPYGSRTSLLAPVSSEICKSMRTLATFGSRISTLDPYFILQLKALRTLNLSYNPKEIGELIPLRFLPRLAKLPKAMEKLIKLKHLHVMCCDELKYLPKGIGRLSSSLRALDGFRVCGGDDENDTFELGYLRLLDKLEGSLFISEIGNLTDAGEVKKAQLWNKKHILHLGLDFSNGDNAEGDGRSDVEILNDLEGPQNLESLDIFCNYFSTLSPKLMSLHSLRSLTLRAWRYCEVLPPLENLTINDMPSLKKVGVEFLGIEETQNTIKITLTYNFIPKIETTQLRQSLGLGRVWEGVGGSKLKNSEIRIMPCLSSFHISRAHKLQALPDFLWKTPLLELSISKCHVFSYQQGFRKQLKVSHIPNIRINYERIREEGVWIQGYDETDTSDFDEGNDEIVQEKMSVI